MEIKHKVRYDSEEKKMHLILLDVEEGDEQKAYEYMNSLSIIGRTSGYDGALELKNFFQKNPEIGQLLPKMMNPDGTLNHVVLGEMAERGILKL